MIRPRRWRLRYTICMWLSRRSTTGRRRTGRSELFYLILLLPITRRPYLLCLITQSKQPILPEMLLKHG